MRSALAVGAEALVLVALVLVARFFEPSPAAPFEVVDRLFAERALGAIALLLLKHVRALLVRGANRGEYDGANCPGAIELLCSQQLRDWHATRVSTSLRSGNKNP